MRFILAIPLTSCGIDAAKYTDAKCKTKAAQIQHTNDDLMPPEVVRLCDYRATPIVIKEKDNIFVMCKCPTETNDYK